MTSKIVPIPEPAATLPQYLALHVRELCRLLDVDELDSNLLRSVNDNPNSPEHKFAAIQVAGWMFRNDVEVLRLVNSRRCVVKLAIGSVYVDRSRGRLVKLLSFDLGTAYVAPHSAPSSAYYTASTDLAKIDLLGLSFEEFVEFRSACSRTLDAISPDLPGRHSRSAIVEVVLDADYMRMYGNRRDAAEFRALYDSKLEPWIRANYHSPKFAKLMKLVFPFASYDL